MLTSRPRHYGLRVWRRPRCCRQDCGRGRGVMMSIETRVVTCDTCQVSPRHSRPYQAYLQSCSTQGCAMCGATLINKRYDMVMMVMMVMVMMMLMMIMMTGTPSRRCTAWRAQ